MSRTLASALRSFVTAPCRRRGENYVRDGRVAVVTSTAAAFSAVVRGTRRYDVTLTLEADSLKASCTCPYFTDTLDPCKHVWAAILTADRDRVFDVPHEIWLDTDEVAPTPDEIAGFLDELAGDDALVGPPSNAGRRLTGDQRLTVSQRMKQYWAERRRASAPGPRAALVSRPRPEPPPAWQMFLSQVRPPVAAGPPTRALLTGELIYVFDPARSVAAGGLLVELVARDRKKSGDWARPRPFALNRRDIAGLPNDGDRRVLDAVCGAEPSHGPAGYGWSGYAGSLPVPSTFVLSHTLQRDLMPRLCETGRLLLRVAPNAVDPRADPMLVPIVWEPEAASFHLRITGDTSAGYTISGAVLSGGRERAFSEALFVTGALILWGPREAGGSPRFAALETGGADRWMAQVLSAGPVTVPASHAAELTEALARR